MQTITCTKATMPALLAQSSFLDRGYQFVERLKWDLCVTPQGFEIDSYDDAQADYLAVHDNGRHLVSCRLRPMTAGTMIADYFLPTFPKAQDYLRGKGSAVVELSRFCRAPDMSVRQSRTALVALGRILETYRKQHGLDGYVAVIFPPVARLLSLIGAQYQIIDRGVYNGRDVEMICLTKTVKDAIAMSPPVTVGAGPMAISL